MLDGTETCCTAFQSTDEKADCTGWKVFLTTCGPVGSWWTSDGTYNEG